jgi:purine-binding chemotaxis protein CheW
VSERHDPPGGESARLSGELGRTLGSGGARDASRSMGGLDIEGLNNGAIIPFEEFARRKAGGLDFQSGFPGMPSSLSASLLGANYATGQMSLHGMMSSLPDLQENTPEQGEQHLIFSLDSFECAIKADQVQAVERLPEVTPVPNVVSWIDGVIHLRGHIVSVVDLRSFLELERQPVSPRTRLVAAQAGDLVVGLVVDGVSEMRGILPSMIQLQHTSRSLPIWAVPYVSGIATIGNRSVMIIDAERLLLSEKMHRYQSGN